MIKIALADGEILFRQGLTEILRKYPHYEVVYSASDGSELLDQIKEKQVEPDIFLLDLQMNPMNGLDTTKLLNQLYEDCKVMILTSHYSPSFVNHMVKIGVSAFLPKGINASELIFAIDTVLEKGIYLTNDYSKAIRSNAKPHRKLHFTAHESLSKKEREVLYWICHGYSNKEISDKMCRSIRTVEGHRQHVIEKTGAKNTAGMVVYALMHKVVDIDEKLLEHTLAQKPVYSKVPM